MPETKCARAIGLPGVRVPNVVQDACSSREPRQAVAAKEKTAKYASKKEGEVSLSVLCWCLGLETLYFRLSKAGGQSIYPKSVLV